MRTLSAIVELRTAIEEQLASLPAVNAWGDSNADNAAWMRVLIVDLKKLEADPSSDVGEEAASWYDGKDSYTLADFLPDVQVGE